jgi:hypothetical protein
MPLLIPSSVPSGSWSNANYNVVFYCRFQAAESGDLNEIRFFSNAGGLAKGGLYSDDAGDADTRLTYDNTGVSVSASQWNSIAVPDYSIVQGTYYHLAILADTAGIATRDGGQSWSSQYQNQPYANGLPSVANPDGGVGYLFSYAGYGDLPAAAGGPGLAMSIGF